ncbi:hypothetical protein RIEGSTA812A_PEG_1002 [invertebrate metagenome]|uniref:Uncharacterized protein n=1 Tax=invertebrate metagenome TaxID=1711999 RepID=A0A484H6A6_9ZZZZ
MLLQHYDYNPCAETEVARPDDNDSRLRRAVPEAKCSQIPW